MWWINSKKLRWVVDSDGDIGLCVLGIFTIVKYKYSAIFFWGGRSLADAPKYLMDATIYSFDNKSRSNPNA